MLSDLQLEHHRLLRLLIEVNPDYMRESQKENYSISLDFDLFRAREKHAFRLPMIIKLNAPRGCTSSRFRRIELQIEGVFSLPDDTSEDMIQQLVPNNCLAILYGMARGIAAGATGMAPGGAFILPSVNFALMIKEKNRKHRKNGMKNGNKEGGA